MDIIAKKFIQLKNKEKFDEYYCNKLKSKHKKIWNNQKYIFKILHFLFQFMKFMNLKKTGCQYIWKENHYNIQKEEEEE